MSTPEQKLKRLLHYGRPIPFYQPHDKHPSAFYHLTVQLAIEELLTVEKLSNAANCIVKAFSDGYSARPSMLVFALAVCAKQRKNEQLREATYKAIKTVCASSENFFLFIQYAAELNVQKLTWGSGCRKVCKDWYLNKDVKTLAEIVGRQKKCHGWSHKDIIKLIHLKTEEPARAAIIKYLMFGIQAAKKEYGENAEASEVLNYLQAVEDFKRLTDEQQAARNIEIHKFTLDHVPPHLVKFKEVWSALVGTLPLPVLIKNLERMGYLGFLKPHSPIVSKVVDALSDKNSIAESHLHPAQVYITLRSYETSSKLLVAENARKRKRAENGSGEPKKIEVPPKPNLDVISALQRLFACTCKLFLTPTGLRYFVAIDIKSFHHTEKCYRCQHVTPAQATVLITLCLQHAERNVSVRVAGTNDELVPVTATFTTMTVQRGVKRLEEIGMHRMKLSAPLEWALKKKEEHDIFIVITDTVHKRNNNMVNVLQKYREEMKIPNAKLILVLLKCHCEPVWLNNKEDPGVFVIGGFDEKVPRLIEAFSRGAF